MQVQLSCLHLTELLVKENINIFEFWYFIHRWLYVHCFLINLLRLSLSLSTSTSHSIPPSLSMSLIYSFLLLIFTQLISICLIGYNRSFFLLLITLKLIFFLTY